ncbi:LANO_0G14554g1_1 [Lachancea nothofagi CBS 11611]|uniref:CDP-diacylglycerol--glycerol-3-phosphate 3-phosphatidyltransferase n=1 Tax=Lachancea nothofagi CBS 11611 TaxID=1266666 RepID=A0A1G4KK57_9SACH|nr:LANO_0G14554g1_1 [Lachancea nothofagi CBS 11611]
MRITLVRARKLFRYSARSEHRLYSTRTSRPMDEFSVRKSSLSYTDAVRESLSNLKACFYFRKDEIEVLHSPTEFYDTLKNKIFNAERRIFLASLYIGTSQEELIACISKALDKNPNLKVYFLVDGLRGTREAPKSCSASLLSRLVKNHQDRVDIRLYRTPELTRLKEALIPRRFNEGIGLQHMKIYGVDDEVILSGANLSTDYFTNRQDRYYLFKSPQFADYYYDLHQLVSRMSYQVQYSESVQKFKMVWPKDNLSNEPHLDRGLFLKSCSDALRSFLNKPRGSLTNQNISKTGEFQTAVYPISQFTPMFRDNKDYSTEKPTILKILSCMRDSSISWTFTAGYFNMLPEIKNLLLLSPSKEGRVITASPYANGFFQSKGLSRHLPDAYLHLSQKFLQDVKNSGRESQISLNEWKKGIVNTPEGWSYHAKGIWVSENDPKDTRPAVTVVGSSNYTRRAYSVDLESNVVLVTKDSQLKNVMQAEIDRLMSNTKPVTIQTFNEEHERQVSLGVRVATKIIGKRL